jgi:general secretion pathway protein K
MRQAFPTERGVALALGLWMMVLLGALAASVVTTTRSQSTVLLNARARVVARYAAESGLVAGTTLLERRLAGAYTVEQQLLALSGLEQEVADLGEVVLGNAYFGLVVTNLNARLDLNQAEPATLIGLFSQFVQPPDARAVVDALQDWADADNLVRPHGAESETYHRAGSPFVPRNAPLRRVDELRWVRGVTDSLAASVAPYVTVDGDTSIDVNAASETVLAALPEIGQAGARSIVSHRRQGGSFASVSEVQSLLGMGAGTLPNPRLTITPNQVLLVSRGRLAGHRLTHEIQAAYALIGQRLILRSWRERDL